MTRGLRIDWVWDVFGDCDNLLRFALKTLGRIHGTADVFLILVHFRTWYSYLCSLESKDDSRVCRD